MENLFIGWKGKEIEMIEELKKLIAFIFQRSGKEKMNEKEFYMSLSFELGWLTPGEGMKVIEKAVEKNLLAKENDVIYPTFEYKNVEIPLGFKFDGNKLKEMEKDLFSRIVDKIIMESKLGEKKVRKEIENIERDLNVYPEIAGIFFAKKIGINVEGFIEEAKNLIKSL